MNTFTKFPHQELKVLKKCVPKMFLTSFGSSISVPSENISWRQGYGFNMVQYPDLENSDWIHLKYRSEFRAVNELFWKLYASMTPKWVGPHSFNDSRQVLAGILLRTANELTTNGKCIFTCVLIVTFGLEMPNAVHFNRQFSNLILKITFFRYTPQLTLHS